jgi:hypothetical protein
MRGLWPSLRDCYIHFHMIMHDGDRCLNSVRQSHLLHLDVTFMGLNKL